MNKLLMTILLIVAILICIGIERWRDKKELQRMEEKREQEAKKQNEKQEKLYEDIQDINTGNNSDDAQHMADKLHEYANRNKTK